MNKNELKALLETPLDPNLDYFDATASIEAIAEHLRGLHKLVGFLCEGLATQGQSILELRREIVEIKGDLAQAGVARGEEPDSGLIGFDKPDIIIDRKH